MLATIGHFFFRHRCSVRSLRPDFALEGRFLSQKGSPSDVKLAAFASEGRLCEDDFATSFAAFSQRACRDEL